MVFAGSSTNGRSIIDQLAEEKVEMGWDTYIVPYGRDTISAIYPAQLRHPGRDDLRRPQGRPGAKVPRILQEPGVRLRAHPRRGRRLQVRHRRRGDRHGLPDHRRHRHPPDPADGYLHLRARRARVRLRQDRAPLHRGPGGQGDGLGDRHPRLLFRCLRGRARPARGHARRIRRQERPGLRIRPDARDGRGRGREDRSHRAGYRHDNPGQPDEPRDRGGGGRPRHADRFRVPDRTAACTIS